MIQTKKGTKEKVVKPFNVQIEKSSKDLLKDRTIAYPNPDGSPSIMHCSLTLKDVHLRVNVPNATVVENDLSCNSTFMQRIMTDIGTSIRTHYSFVHKDTPVYLFMDKTGGHGKDVVKRNM